MWRKELSAKKGLDGENQVAGQVRGVVVIGNQNLTSVFASSIIVEQLLSVYH